MATMPLKDLTVYYEDEGSGPALLCLHGGLDAASTFRDLMPSLRAHFRVIAHDQRAHGRTLCEKTDWTHWELAQDAVSLMDALGIERFSIVGHSMGGDISMMIASSCPERIVSLVSIGSAANPRPRNKKFLEQFNPAKAPPDMDFIMKRLAEMHAPAQKGDWFGLFASTVRNVSLFPYFTDDALRGISSPFLLLAGEHDHFADYRDVARLASLCPNFSSAIVKHAGHFMHRKGPGFEECRKLLLDFLLAHPA